MDTTPPDADAIAWRRHLHANPELSFHEHETSQFVHETLASFGGLVLERPTPTSVVARLHGDSPGRTLALRADMDALPINEESGVEFASRTEGVMHDRASARFGSTEAGAEGGTRCSRVAAPVQSSRDGATVAACRGKGRT